MSAIVDGLIVEPKEYVSTGQPNVLRPVYGSSKNMNVSIETLRVYNEDQSEKTGKEVYEDVTVAMIRTDKYSCVPVRVSQLSREMTRDLAHLIEAHKEQKDVDELRIMDWQAISSQDKKFILDMQVYTVNQLSYFPKTEAYKLGPMGARLIELAERHVETNAKEKREKEESLETVKVLRAELEALKNQLAAKEASKTVDVVEVEAKKAKAKKASEEA
jgi:hypothetical protein